MPPPGLVRGRRSAGLAFVPGLLHMPHWASTPCSRSAGPEIDNGRAAGRTLPVSRRDPAALRRSLRKDEPSAAFVRASDEEGDDYGPGMAPWARITRAIMKPWGRRPLATP